MFTVLCVTIGVPVIGVPVTGQVVGSEGIMYFLGSPGNGGLVRPEATYEKSKLRSPGSGVWLRRKRTEGANNQKVQGQSHCRSA